MEKYGFDVGNAGSFIGLTDAFDVVFDLMMRGMIMMMMLKLMFCVICATKRSPLMNGTTPKQGIDDIVLFEVKTIEVKSLDVEKIFTFV